MSSRALRRLQEQKEKHDTVPDNDGDDDLLAGNSVRKKSNKKKAARITNPFEVLADEDNHDEETKEENSENFNETNNINNVKKKQTNSKKKNKKKKNKQKNITNTDECDLDEIDRSIKEVNEILGIESTQVSNSGVASTQDIPIFKSRSILVVDPRNLNPDNEMKRRFGASVLQNERRRNPHQRKFKRSSCLVTPKPSWPPYHKVGITMTKISSEEDSSSMFTFEHQESYRKIQFMFYDAVESIDHNNIIALLNAHPYHIDSMLQLSEICKMNEDFQMAAELIERALFVFENSFHIMFNITQGTCRLKYQRTENRPFFLALFRHIHYLGDKACYVTALEFCKVLLGLDCSDDPLCVLLMIDYYAMKAEEYNYFIQLTDEYEYVRNVSLLPNFAYSYALAKFYLGKMEEADTALQNALVSFPSLLVELMDKNGISLDDTIKKNPYFDPVSYIGQSAPLNQLVSLYVGRCCSLWKAPDVLNWLVSNSKFIIDNLEKFTKHITEAARRRLTRYKTSPRNILRHIVISDIKEASRALPVEIRNQTVMQYDPLPPLDSVTGYERPTRANQRQQTGNLFSLFLQSFMPSYNQNEPRQMNEELRVVDELHNQAIALDQDDQSGMNAVQGGAQQLMNAMRELLNTMTYRNDAEENQNEASDDEDWEN